MIVEDDLIVGKVYPCPQCPKRFATRSNLKRHMENPNIHNIPYVRSRDQKRWKGHSKKVVSKEETTESNNDRMRKWRAENREKNRQNDLRCRVYRLARQKYGEHDSIQKQGFVREEIARRLGRRLYEEKSESNTWVPIRTNMYRNQQRDMSGLPFYSAPQQKIELPKLSMMNTNEDMWSLSPPPSSATASPDLPHLSPSLQRRRSSGSISSINSNQSKKECRSSTLPNNSEAEEDEFCVLPSMQSFLSYAEQPTTKGMIRYVESSRILDEFVGVVLTYADRNNSQ